MSEFKYLRDNEKYRSSNGEHEREMEIAHQLKRIADLLDESNEWERIKGRGC